MGETCGPENPAVLNFSSSFLHNPFIFSPLNNLLLGGYTACELYIALYYIQSFLTPSKPKEYVTGTTIRVLIKNHLGHEQSLLINLLTRVLIGQYL